MFIFQSSSIIDFIGLQESTLIYFKRFSDEKMLGSDLALYNDHTTLQIWISAYMQ